MKMTNSNPEAVYACLNYGEAYALREIAKQSICMDGNIADVLRKLR